MLTLAFSGFLNVDDSLASENPNPHTVRDIVHIIKELGLKENDAETRNILFDALQGLEIKVTEEEIHQAFRDVASEETQRSKKKGARELTPADEKTAYKMWLMQQALDKRAREERLPVVSRDVQNVIGGKLHNLSVNPVLDGELIYTRTPDEPPLIFKFKDLAKEGTLDLSNPAVFG